MYIYLGMYGIKTATADFTKDFKFSFNEWSDAYTDADTRIKALFIETLRPSDYAYWYSEPTFMNPTLKQKAFFDIAGKQQLFRTDALHALGVFNDVDMAKYFNSTTVTTIADNDGYERDIEENNFEVFLQSHDVSVSISFLCAIANKYLQTTTSASDFKDTFKKLFPSAQISVFGTGMNREYYVKMRLSTGNKVIFI